MGRKTNRIGCSLSRIGSSSGSRSIRTGCRMSRVDCNRSRTSSTGSRTIRNTGWTNRIDCRMSRAIQHKQDMLVNEQNRAQTSRRTRWIDCERSRIGNRRPEAVSA